MASSNFVFSVWAQQDGVFTASLKIKNVAKQKGETSWAGSG
jgi:hypothetical protein